MRSQSSIPDRLSPFAKKPTQGFHFRTQGQALEGVLADLWAWCSEADEAFRGKLIPPGRSWGAASKKGRRRSVKGNRAPGAVCESPVCPRSPQ